MSGLVAFFGSSDELHQSCNLAASEAMSNLILARPVSSAAGMSSSSSSDELSLSRKIPANCSQEGLKISGPGAVRSEGPFLNYTSGGPLP